MLYRLMLYMCNGERTNFLTYQQVLQKHGTSCDISEKLLEPKSWFPQISNGNNLYLIHLLQELYKCI